MIVNCIIKAVLFLERRCELCCLASELFGSASGIQGDIKLARRKVDLKLLDISTSPVDSSSSEARDREFAVCLPRLDSMEEVASRL